MVAFQFFILDSLEHHALTLAVTGLPFNSLYWIHVKVPPLTREHLFEAIFQFFILDSVHEDSDSERRVLQRLSILYIGFILNSVCHEKLENNKFLSILYIGFGDGFL